MKINGTRKICLVTSSFPRHEADYAGNFIDGFLRVLSDRYEIHVVYPSNEEERRIESEPFFRHPIPYPFKTYPMSQVHGTEYIKAIGLCRNILTQIKTVIREHDISLIHAYWAIPSGFLAALTRGKIPLIMTLPGSDIKIFSRRTLFKYPVKYTLKKSTRIIAVSNDLKEAAIKLGTDEGKISVIPTGVDMEKFKPMDKQALRSELGLPDGFLMLAAGSLLRVKRVDRLIKICQKLNHDSECNLIITSDGPERENLNSLIKSLKVKNVRFTGEIPDKDVPRYMAAADVLVLASESEGLPTCVQEAMACGIPVVTSDVGGLPEIVHDGFNGYLTHSENEMEERLRLLMASPELVVTLGANALEFARQNLSLDMVTKKTEEVYASVLDEASGKIPWNRRS